MPIILICGVFFLVMTLFIDLGRYSPVRRASEGSKHQPLIHGPLQECQQLIQQQKGLAHRNLSLTQSPPLLDTSSLPGSYSSREIIFFSHRNAIRSKEHSSFAHLISSHPCFLFLTLFAQLHRFM